MVELSPFAAFFLVTSRKLVLVEALKNGRKGVKCSMLIFSGRDPDQQNFKIGSFPSKWDLEKKVQNTYNSISILGGGSRYFYPLKMVIGSS